MLMFCIVILLVGLIAWMQASQGFLSALLNFSCVVAAGAIAFGVWEFVAVDLIMKYGKMTWVTDMAWGLSLIWVFAFALALLRGLSIKACPANTDFSEAVNFIGGGVVGLANGVLTAGICIIALQLVPGSSELVPGYSGWEVENDGTVVPAAGMRSLKIPVDKWTSDFYAKGSQGSMYAPNSLAEWHPGLAQQASLFRKSYEEGDSRQAMKAGKAKAKAVYRIDADDADEMQEFVRGLAGISTQHYPQTRGGTGDIYVIETAVERAARDGGGALRLTKAQVRLIVKDGNNYIPIHPHAFIQQYLTDSADIARFLYDSNDLAAVSVGGESETSVLFEFLVPPNARPHHLIIKQTRADLPAVDPEPWSLDDLLDYNVPEDVKPPGGGTPAPPKHWVGMLASFASIALVVFVSIKEVKRTHQD